MNQKAKGIIGILTGCSYCDEKAGSGTYSGDLQR